MISSVSATHGIGRVVLTGSFTKIQEREQKIGEQKFGECEGKESDRSSGTVGQ